MSSDLTDSLVCKAKVWSTNQDELLSICVGALVIWCNPNCDVILSTEIFSGVLLSLTTSKYGIPFESESTVISKLSENVAKSA